MQTTSSLLGMWLQRRHRPPRRRRCHLLGGWRWTRTRKKISLDQHAGYFSSPSVVHLPVYECMDVCTRLWDSFVRTLICAVNASGDEIVRFGSLLLCWLKSHWQTLRTWLPERSPCHKASSLLYNGVVLVCFLSKKKTKSQLKSAY